MRDVPLDEFAAAGEDDAAERSDTPGTDDDPSAEPEDGESASESEREGSESADESESDSAAATEQTAGSASDDDADTEHDDPTDSHRREIASVSAWSTSGGVCEACGASATRRWRESAQLVCPACKQWS